MAGKLLLDAAPARVRQVLSGGAFASPAVWAELVAEGETPAAAWRDVRAAAGDDGGDGDEHDDEVRCFLGLVEWARNDVRRRRDREAAESPCHFQARHSRDLLDGKRRRLEDWFLERASHGLMATRPTPPPSRLSTSHRATFRRDDGDATTTTRASAELGRREKYIEELVDLLQSLGAPSAVEAARSAEPRSVLALMAAGRRAATLRTRLRAWRAFGRWLSVTYQLDWPTHHIQLLEYCKVRAAEPCGRSTLRGAIAAVAFVEKCGGYGGDDLLTKSSVFREACKELMAGLTARADGQGGQQAPRPTCGLLMRLEMLVADISQPPWIRAYAWWKLLQCWSALRFDDHRGIVPAAVIEESGGLIFDLTRSKTSGSDKRTELRPSGISYEAYLLESDWIKMGWEIWRGIAPHERDFLLSVPNKALDSTRPRELHYAEAAGWSRAVIGLAVTDIGDQQTRNIMAAHYTEHSGRCFLSSAALAMGAEEKHLLPIGGWSASSARSYLRTARERLWQVQGRVANWARANRGGADAFGEHQCLRELERIWTAGGVPMQSARRAREALTYFVEPPPTRQVWETGTSTPPLALEDRDRREADTADAGRGPSVGERAGGSRDGVRETDPSARGDGDDVAAGGSRLPTEVTGYVVSITGRSRYRRLHLLGKCHRVPGVDYVDYELLGPDLPGPEAYHGHCGQCWRKQGPQQELKQERAALEEPWGDHTAESEDSSSSSEL